VKLEFKLDEEKSVPPAVAAQAPGGPAIAAAAPAAPAKPVRAGTVTGHGSSCWHSYVIPFTIRGTFDLTSRTAA
jgi:hypothetical protein